MYIWHEETISEYPHLNPHRKTDISSLRPAASLEFKNNSGGNLQE
jgi:hypothetical protein